MQRAVDELREAIEVLRADASRVAGSTQSPDMERLWTGKAIAYETVLGAMARICPPRPTLVICQCPGYEKVRGQYPSGFCRDCGNWYPGKCREEPPSINAVEPQAGSTGKPATRV